MKRIVIYLVISCLTALLITGQSFSAAPKPVYARSGMVVSASPIASQVGVDILKAGGNAVDAGVAAAFALGVVEQYSSGIGGGCFIMIYLAENDSVIVIDGREKAPLAAKSDMYCDSTGMPNPALSTEGILAGGVPGEVAALELARAKYGTKKLAELLKPSIELAEKGFVVSPTYGDHLVFAAPLLTKFPDSKAVYFKNDTTVWQTGDVLLQKDLAWSYKQLADKGVDAFYRGAIADKIVEFQQKNGGLITKEDLANYQPALRKPVRGTYRGCDIISMPPPSSGGVHLIQMLNILENYNLKQMGHNSSLYLHTLAEAMKPAFADRAQYLGDPDFVTIPIDTILSKGYSQALYSKMQTFQTGDIKPGLLEIKTEGHTTHLSVVDKSGNMCAITATVNTGYGSGMTIAGTGIILNNEMDDFSAAVGAANYFGLVGNEANSIQPGKRPLSSMTPTFVLKDHQPVMVLGSPGGPRIITAVLQTILNTLDFGMDIQDAVAAPRVHHQWRPDVFFVEYDIPTDVLENLVNKGHRIRTGGAGSTVEAIYIDKLNGWLYGGADPRNEGKAVGY